MADDTYLTMKKAADAKQSALNLQKQISELNNKMDLIIALLEKKTKTKKEVN